MENWDISKASDSLICIGGQTMKNNQMYTTKPLQELQFK